MRVGFGRRANRAARRMSFALRYSGFASRNAATVLSTCFGSASMRQIVGGGVVVVCFGFIEPHDSHWDTL